MAKTQYKPPPEHPWRRKSKPKRRKRRPTEIGPIESRVEREVQEAEEMLEIDRLVDWLVQKAEANSRWR